MGAPTYVGHGTAVSPAGASGTCTLPTGWAQNDILVIQLLQGSTDTLTPPAGWSVLTTATESTNQGMNKLLWKRATASESSVAVTPVYWAVMHAFRGCPTTGNPWDVFASSSQVTTTAVSFPSVTTTVDNTLIFLSTVGSGSGTASGWANANLTSVTEVIDSPLTNARGDAATGIAATHGSTGTSSATLSASAGWMANITVAFKTSEVSGTAGIGLPHPVGSSIAATVILPNGPITSALRPLAASFTGTAAPPSGSLATTLPSAQASLAGTATGGPLVMQLPSPVAGLTGGLVYGSVTSVLPKISASLSVSVNPIGAFADTLPKLSTDFLLETRPHGSNVIIVEDEQRGLLITEDDVTPIYRKQASIFLGGVQGVNKYTLPRMTSNFGSNGGNFACMLPSPVISDFEGGNVPQAAMDVTLRRMSSDASGLSGTQGSGAVGATLPSLQPDLEGYSAVQWAGAGTFVSGTASVAPTLPSGYQQGDVFILAVNAGPGDTVDTPSGWAPLAPTPQVTSVGDSTDTQLLGYWKVAASFSEVAPTVTGTGDHLAAVIHGFRGTLGTALSPIDVSGGSATESSGTLVTMPSVTTTGVDEMIVYIGAHGVDTTTPQASLHSNTPANLTNLTERSDNSFTDGTGGGLYVYTGNCNTIRFVGSDTFDLATASARAQMTVALLVDKDGGAFAVGGTLDTALPSLAFAGDDSPEGSLSSTLPHPLVTAVTGTMVFGTVAVGPLPSISTTLAGNATGGPLAVTLPSVAALAPGTVHYDAVLAATLPAPLVTSMAGSTTGPGSGSISATLPTPLVTSISAQLEDMLKYVHAVGDGSSTSITVTHSFNSRDVSVTVYDATTYAEVDCQIVHTTLNAVTLTFAVAPATNAYNVVVLYSSL